MVFNRRNVRKAFDKRGLSYAIINGNLYLLKRDNLGEFNHYIGFIFDRKGRFVNVNYEKIEVIVGEVATDDENDEGV